MSPYVKGFEVLHVSLCERFAEKVKEIQCWGCPKEGQTLFSNLSKLKQKGDMEDRCTLYHVVCAVFGMQRQGSTIAIGNLSPSMR